MNMLEIAAELADLDAKERGDNTLHAMLDAVGLSKNDVAEYAEPLVSDAVADYGIKSQKTTEALVEALLHGLIVGVHYGRLTAEKVPTL